MNINAVAKSERERALKDIRRIMDRISCQLLTGSDSDGGTRDDPYVFTASLIASNGTIRKKTMRLLIQMGAFDYTSDKGYHFEQAFIDHSDELAVEPEFDAIPAEVRRGLETTDYIGNIRTHFDTLESMGYQYITQMPAGYLTWVCKHLDDYRFIDGKGLGVEPGPKAAKCYPVALIKERQKAVLRGLIKRYAEVDYKEWVESTLGGEYTGQTEHSETEDEDGNITTDMSGCIDFSIELRNFARYPVAICDLAYDSPKGYGAEYEKVMSRANFEYTRLVDYIRRVKEFGGFVALKETYLRESVSSILMKAPLMVNGDDEEKAAANYLLNNSDKLTYEYLYGGKEEPCEQERQREAA